ncbi:hypothetical protein PTQ21_01265 [Paenibacillus marchantiae]|uniref:hypothetical protein n=1 Tax=Paenibacillus marchantiae TaxID=3026433 RepID=UPI00237B2B53|nr:hypothetical protein [Paenibacillus marchantiae]WDQ33005.1 hypothetical protein PTQ21_01265 [Paenibacillus marchantiae]
MDRLDCIILSIIAGILVGQNEFNGFQWSLALPVMMNGIIAGLLLLGVAEIIRLVQDIKNETVGPD